MSESTAFKVFSGVTGSVVAFMFGEWNQLFTLFFFAMGVDYISGITASRRCGEPLDSKRGFKGITKKFFVIILIALSHHIDLTFNTNFVMTGFVYFFLANELISIKENYERMGISLPDMFFKVIDYLKKKPDEQNNQFKK